VKHLFQVYRVVLRLKSIKSFEYF